MDLSEQQRQAVRSWMAEGASLSDVQKRLKSEFDYADIYGRPASLLTSARRFKTSPTQNAEPAADHVCRRPKAGPSTTYSTTNPAAGFRPRGRRGGGKVSLTLDRLVVPGAMFSGDVTFSDGVKARWMIDQIGRFGLDPEKPGYRPSDADLQAFQLQLRSELQRHGYA